MVLNWRQMLFVAPIGAMAAPNGQRQMAPWRLIAPNEGPGGDETSGQVANKKCLKPGNPPALVAGTGMAPSVYSVHNYASYDIQCVTRAPRCTLHGASPPGALPHSAAVHPSDAQAEGGAGVGEASSSRGRG
eukprot:gene15604-biopygen13101